MRRNPQFGPWSFRERDAVELIALRRVDHHDYNTVRGAANKVVAELLGIPVGEAERLFYTDDGSALLYKLGNIAEDIKADKYAPPIPKNHVRFLHSVLQPDTPSARWQTIKSILTGGLVPQPEGAGRFSEAPWLVFGIASFGDRPNEELLYNPYTSWVSADIPLEEFANWDRPTRSGNVMTLNAVPPEYITAINGLPRSQFVKAMKKWGYPSEVA